MAKIDLPKEYLNPPLMAIGDSMYQGVRSLTFSAELFRHSPPAQVARALGDEFASFTYPQPERPMFMDMEAFVRLIPNIGAIDKQVEANAQYWKSWWTEHQRGKTEVHGIPCFDNIAVASMDISDLYDFNWDLRVEQAKALLKADVSKISDLLDVAIPGPPGAPGGTVGDALLGINACHTLNPLGLDSLRKVQPVELVLARAPEILLVNIGANEGLFNVGFNAKALLNQDFVNTMLAKYRKLAQRLSQLDERTKKIVFNTVVHPSQIPNLMPRPQKITLEGIPPGADGCYDEYENRMGFGYGWLPGISRGNPPVPDLKGQDAFMRAVNAGMMSIMSNVLGERAVFADLATAMTALDYKHRRGRQGVDTITVKGTNGDPKRITNEMIEDGLPRGLNGGGLCGLDGMHPSVVGYGRIAREVLDALGHPEAQIDYDICYRQDTLLTNVPRRWSIMMALFRDYRRDFGKREAAFLSSSSKRDRTTVSVLSAASRLMPSPRE